MYALVVQELRGTYSMYVHNSREGKKKRKNAIFF